MNAYLTRNLVWDHIRESRQQAAAAMARFGRRVAGLVAECDYAQRRMLALRTTPDAYLTDRDKAPDDYAEFLFRTSSVMLHEPAAAGRAHGRPVR
jgi:hypothetical protein